MGDRAPNPEYESIFPSVRVRGIVERFPKGMRYATLEERKEFYEREFDVQSVDRWLVGRRKTLKFAVIPGRHTRIYKPELEEDKDSVIIIDVWRNAADLRRWVLKYLPEAVYYDRNRYIDVAQCRKCGQTPRYCEGCYNYDGQQLAFDLDPENVDCPVHGTIGDKIDSGRGMLSFCMIEFASVRRQARELAHELRKEYDEVAVVYSGRGFHVVVEDESGYRLTRKERRSIAKKTARRFDIDEWVTEGGSRLMRLPYSLNALVSRKCMRIKEERDLARFDPRTSGFVMPDYLKSA